MEDDEHRPRPSDHLVEPFYAGLRDGDAAREDPRKGPREPRRGCGGAALLVMLALVAAWLVR